MSWETEIANQFKIRNNPKLIGATVGRVLSVSPFKVTILDGRIMLDSDNCYICGALLDREITATLEGTSRGQGNIRINDSIASAYIQEGNFSAEGMLQLKSGIQVGDSVLVLPDAKEQIFFIIDVIKGVL